MIPDPVELLPTRLTPPPAPGLQLALACGWAFGLLRVDEPGADPRTHEAWARSINVHAYADGEPAIRSRPLLGGRRLLADPLPERTTGGPLTVPFVVDLQAWLGDGAWFVWATAREHASAPRRVELPAAPLELDDPTPGEALLLARARLRAGRVLEADALFAAALRDERLAADPDAGASLDAACAAARRGSEGLALSLLRDGVRSGQRALAAALQGHVLGGLDGVADPRFGELVAQEVARLAGLRDQDPDLASLRGSPAFRAVFQPAR